MKSRKKLVNFAVGAIVAALYVVLTYLASAMGLSSGVIQVRFSEALTILPVFTSAAIPGLFIGCLISNILTGCALWDVIFGSIATLLGAVFTYLLRKHKVLAVLPPIIANTIIVPPVLIFVYGVSDTYWFILLTVCIGEVISCGIIGTALRKSLEKTRVFERI
ncbi:MAG: QueT transporter family protein [Clostridia bacterium]|nr:QueT transporter family protein [Clostridia bacterium]